MVQRPHIPHQLAIKHLTPDRVIDLVKRVLHHVVRVQLIDLLQDRIHILLRRLREYQKLGPRQRLKALQPEVLRLQHFDA